MRVELKLKVGGEKTSAWVASKQATASMTTPLEPPGRADDGHGTWSVGFENLLESGIRDDVRGAECATKSHGKGDSQGKSTSQTRMVLGQMTVNWSSGSNSDAPPGLRRTRSTSEDGLAKLARPRGQSTCEKELMAR